MKSDKEWAIRFAWLMGEAAFKAGVDAWPDRVERAALHLGREMADERAEEIERQCTEGLPSIVYRNSYGGGLHEAGRIARSTITKPKEPLELSHTTTVKAHEAAIRADEREKIAQQIDGELYDDSRRETATQALCRLRNQLRGEPKTREQVMEEALTKITRYYERGTDAEYIARRALEWKP